MKEFLRTALPAVVAVATPTAVAAQSAPATVADGPEANLPANISQLTHFGERPSWSPDGSKIAFMAKSFGDAFEVDVKTGHVRLLTHFPGPGFLRVQYLPNGDLMLIGARNFVNVRQTRYSDQELWLLKKGSNAQPIALEQKMTEGIAISRSRMTIAWAVDSRTHPGEIPSGQAVIYTGEIQERDGRPVIANKRAAVTVSSPDCVGTEPQDFRNNDNELIFVCYTYNKVLGSNIRSVDLRTGKVTIYRNLPEEYNEVEGIYPDGRHTLVESSKDQKTNTSKTIDIWKLRLQPGSTDMTRLTRWGDYDGYKASNPVVSPDGRTIAFQSAKSSDEAGVGYGIFLLKE